MLLSTISVESEEERGSTFTKCVPVKYVKQEPNIQDKEIEEPFKQKTFSSKCSHLLIVVDSSSSSLLYLEDYCKQIHVAQNALKAIDILKQQPVQIVFSDIKLPDMNGYELLK